MHSTYFLRFFSLVLSIAIASLSLTGCAKQDSNKNSNLPFRQLVLESSNSQGDIAANGSALIEFELGASTTAIQLVFESTGRVIRLRTLRDSDSQLLFDAENTYDADSTQADSFSREINVFNFPNLGQGKLQPLGKGIYRARVVTEALPKNEYSGIVDSVVRLTVLAKSDSDLTQGTIPIKIFESGAVAGSSDSIDAINNSLDVVSEIFARAGLNLAVSFEFDPSVPENLPSPAKGDDMYRRKSLGQGGFIPIYFASSVTGLSAPLNPIALAGNSPGPLIPTARSAIAVSLNAAGGADRIIDSVDDRNDQGHTSEVRLLGEALAHEILHYLGLQDTLVFSGGSAIEGDGSDSPKCISIEACRYDPDAPHNIMFPFALDRKRGGVSNPIEQDQNIPREFFSTLQTVTAQLAIGVE